MGRGGWLHPDNVQPTPGDRYTTPQGVLGTGNIMVSIKIGLIGFDPSRRPPLMTEYRANQASQAWLNNAQAHGSAPYRLRGFVGFAIWMAITVDQPSSTVGRDNEIILIICDLVIADRAYRCRVTGFDNLF